MIHQVCPQIAGGMKQIKLGYLTPICDFNYVKDTARGFLTLADLTKYFSTLLQRSPSDNPSTLDSASAAKQPQSSSTFQPKKLAFSKKRVLLLLNK